ncbi:acyltransferase [Hymenobacter gummosus]|nr:acyltransferase [Hymenobacter gummosus]
MLNLLLSCGPVDGTGPTRLHVRGKLRLLGGLALGRGCMIDVGPNAVMEVGDNTYINPRTQVIIHHGLRIGRDCSISWECQFLDEDFHEIHYEGKRPSLGNDIVIGDHVWIGSRVSVYKGTVIPNGCVVASNSVVKGVFTEENALLAGNPARVVRRNVRW